MSEYQKLKARAQELQAEREALVKRELAAKKERELAVSKDEEARRQRLDAAAAEARRRELIAANAALTTVSLNGSSASIQYDPFAEDTPGQSSAAGPSKARSKLATGGRSGGGGTMRGSAASGSSVKREPRSANGGGGGGGRDKRKERSVTPPLLGRKERAARAFAEQIKKQAKADSLFSVRSLVETDDRGPASPRPKSIKPSQPRLNPPTGARTLSRTLSAPAKKGAVPVNEFRKLAPDRANWDRRTIDEIQRDIRAAKGKGVAVDMVRTQSAEHSGRNGAGANGSVKRPRSNSPVKVAQSTPVAAGRIKPKPPPIPSSARPTSSSGLPAAKRARSPSISSSASSSSTYSRDNRQPGRAQRRRNSVGSLHEEDVSATIQAMFRRPGGRAPVKGGYDSDASSDMEARMSDVEEEERRAAKIARREDEIAEREEKERKARKEREKRERMTGRS